MSYTNIFLAFILTLIAGLSTGIGGLFVLIFRKTNPTLKILIHFYLTRIKCHFEQNVVVMITPQVSSEQKDHLGLIFVGIFLELFVFPPYHSKYSPIVRWLSKHNRNFCW